MSERSQLYQTVVALRKESVDRNIRDALRIACHIVALRKESVDRNGGTIDYTAVNRQSLSARRAWIEMDKLSLISLGSIVALRKESVDRNLSNVRRLLEKQLSLSARRAWIEIARSSLV